MESAALRQTPATRDLSQVGLVALLVVAAAAWAVTAARMDGMDAGPGTELGGLGWFAVVWATMMAAMMFPSLAPTVASLPGSLAARSAFAVGYILLWSAAGVLGYAIVEGVRSLDAGFLGWDEAGPYVAGGVIAGSGLYQLTRVKESCLDRCRTRPPHAYHDRLGALRSGIEYGGFCVGCCWAMMAALFALGVMSIGWMVLVAALIALERLLPWKAIAVRGVAVVLVVLGLAVAFAPEEVPGFTIPGDAMPMMDSMESHPRDGRM